MNRLTLCFVAICLMSTTSAWAQRYQIDPTGTGRLNAALDQVRRDQQANQQLQKAQREQAAREKQMIAAASEEVTAAKIAHRMAIKDMKSAREKAEANVEQSMGLKAALEDVVRAQAAYREASDPVLHTLRASAEFQQAEKKSTTAKEKLKQLQADRSLDESTRKERTTELLADSMAASNLERTALRKDKTANAARERLEALQQKVTELRKQAAAKAESDPGLAAAQATVKTAQDSIKAAEAKLASVRSGGGAVTQQLLQEGDGGGKGNGQAKDGRKN